MDEETKVSRSSGSSSSSSGRAIVSRDGRGDKGKPPRVIRYLVITPGLFGEMDEETKVSRSK